MRGNWCRLLVPRFPSCHQPVLKTFTGPHPFFSHQQKKRRRSPLPMIMTSTFIVHQLNGDQCNCNGTHTNAVNVRTNDALSHHIKHVDMFQLQYAWCKRQCSHSLQNCSILFFPIFLLYFTVTINSLKQNSYEKKM